MWYLNNNNRGAINNNELKNKHIKNDVSVCELKLLNILIKSTFLSVFTRYSTYLVKNLKKRNALVLRRIGKITRI